MNRPAEVQDRRRYVCDILWMLVLFRAFGVGFATAQEGVVSTVHNLSASGPGEIRSATETEVCKFCHIPHNAVVPNPLWGHALSEVKAYKVPEISASDGAKILAPQPDGSSRLCLSCHDGTVALGKIAGAREAVRMAGQQRLTPGRRGFLGTDLSGSHPVSFVLRDAALSSSVDTRSDMQLKPLKAITADRHVRLDGAGKMQCTTCHDAHSDRFFEEGKVPRFWVKPSVEEVCLTCHELR